MMLDLAQDASSVVNNLSAKAAAANVDAKKTRAVKTDSVKSAGLTAEEAKNASALNEECLANVIPYMLPPTSS